MKELKGYFKREQIVLLAIFAVFTLVYCLISIVNHYLYRTYALDLGMFNHALYSFAHLKNAYFTLGIDGVEMPFLGTHFSLIVILLSPLYYVFGSYTLIIIQILAILIGGLGIYKYAKYKLNNDIIVPSIILVQFFSIWGIFSALSFDFHCNVLGAMFVPWFIYYLEKRKLHETLFFLILLLISSETIAIWAFFIILGLIVKNWKKHKSEYLRFEVPAALFCLLYGLVVIGNIMPWLQCASNNLQYGRYSQLGGSFGSILFSIIQNPSHTFFSLFNNTLGDPAYDGIKRELFIMVFVSGGLALLLRPVYLIMLIPIFAQKLFSNEYAFWGINGQYSIEFVPILSLAVIDCICNFRKFKIGLAIFFASITLFFTINSLDHRTSKWYNKTNSRFYSKSHYKSDVDISSIEDALKLVDDNSSVSANSCLVPRLAFREKIYHFPIVKDSDYIVLLDYEGGAYPLSVNDFKIKVEELKNSKEYKLIYNHNKLLIFKKSI